MPPGHAGVTPGSSQCPPGSSQCPPVAPNPFLVTPGPTGASIETPSLLPVPPSHNWHHPLPFFPPLPPPEAPLGEDDEDKDLEVVTVTSPKGGGQSSAPSDTDITAEFLQPLLTPENVANLVWGGWGGGIKGGWGRRCDTKGGW